MLAELFRNARGSRASHKLARIGLTALTAAAVFTAIRLLEQPSVAADSQVSLEPLERLGAQLFVDVDFSRNRKQSCATCHNPDFAFADPRISKAGRAVSTGDDGQSLGDRNTPTLMYAHFTPPLTKRGDGTLAGGFFWDGRADTLEEQAKGPLLNPVEMGMPDAATVAERIAEKEDYVARFEALFGPDVLTNPERTLDATAKALAAYQRTREFSPFDSKYDRWMRGEAELTPQEDFGRIVFVTWNCNLCHKPMHRGDPNKELFTNFEYHNIGLPKNTRVRALNGKGDHYIDAGLRDNGRVADEAHTGKFKVPTLRNIAVTAPYMHNGVFETLKTAIQFYNKYTSRRPDLQHNPETGVAWEDPETTSNMSHFQLQTGLSLDDNRIAALEAFLRTLTDKRYEHLLAAPGEEDAR